MACPVRSAEDLPRLEMFAADVDLFILDGAMPGSGQTIDAAIPLDFPYPFLLAGGLHVNNIQAALSFDNCIGVDIASGIETNGQVDVEKINEIAKQLEQLPTKKGG
jgi:phosphoribosylanthranilate isomerase